MFQKMRQLLMLLRHRQRKGQGGRTLTRMMLKARIGGETGAVGVHLVARGSAGVHWTPGAGSVQKLRNQVPGLRRPPSEMLVQSQQVTC